MMTRIIMRALPWAACWALFGASAVAQIPPRLHAVIRNDETFRLAGAVTPILKRAHDIGPADASLPLQLSFRLQMTESQREDLEFFLTQVQSRSSRHFHKFLTPEQFGQRFGPHPADVARIKAWLEEQGFSDIEVGRSGMSIAFSGSAAQVDNAFHTALHQYQLDGETHYANSTEPELPQALSGMVRFIRGLHNFRPQPYSRVRQVPRLTTPGGHHFLIPGDFNAIYGVNLLSSSYTGAGVDIAIVGESDVHLSDIAAFRAAAQLPAVKPNVIVNGTDPGFINGPEGEADLDLEWAGAAAPNAGLIYVVSQNAYDALGYVIDNGTAPIVSMSYGLCESDFTQADNNSLGDETAQGNAEGITIIASSGDSGPANCGRTDPSASGLSVVEPASQPYVTGVGGTAFAPSNLWGDYSGPGLYSRDRLERLQRSPRPSGRRGRSKPLECQAFLAKRAWSAG